MDKKESFIITNSNQSIGANLDLNELKHIKVNAASLLPKANHPQLLSLSRVWIILSNSAAPE